MTSGDISINLSQCLRQTTIGKYHQVKMEVSLHWEWAEFRFIGKSWNIHKATIFSAVCKWKLNTISVLDIVVEEVLWRKCPIGIRLSSVLSLALLCFWTDSCQIESCQGLSTYLTQGITDKDRFKQSKWMGAHYLLSNLHSGHAVGSPFSGRKETKTRKNVLSLRMQSKELNSIDVLVFLISNLI